MRVSGARCVYLPTAVCVRVNVFKYAYMPFVEFVIASERVQAYAHVACSDSRTSAVVLLNRLPNGQCELLFGTM